MKVNWHLLKTLENKWKDKRRWARSSILTSKKYAHSLFNTTWMGRMCTISTPSIIACTNLPNKNKWEPLLRTKEFSRSQKVKVRTVKKRCRHLPKAKNHTTTVRAFPWIFSWKTVTYLRENIRELLTLSWNLSTLDKTRRTQRFQLKNSFRWARLWLTSLLHKKVP